METNAISRRQFLKGAGALIVGFSFFGALSRLLAQSEASSPVTPKRPRSIPGCRSLRTAPSPCSPAKWTSARAW